MVIDAAIFWSHAGTHRYCYVTPATRLQALDTRALSAQYMRFRSSLRAPGQRHSRRSVHVHGLRRKQLCLWESADTSVRHCIDETLRFLLYFLLLQWLYYYGVTSNVRFLTLLIRLLMQLLHIVFSPRLTELRRDARPMRCDLLWTESAITLQRPTWNVVVKSCTFMYALLCVNLALTVYV